MIRKICLITNYNLYESKRYFCQKIAEALNRRGVEVYILDTQGRNIELFFDYFSSLQADVICSFNSTVPYHVGYFFFDKLRLPYLSFIIDPIFYYQNLLLSPYSILSCVDRFDYEFVHSKGFSNLFFLPHAVERELHAFSKQRRSYDVVLVGSCYDHETLRDAWERKFESKICRALEEAIEIGFSDHKTPFWAAAKQALKDNNLELSEIDFNDFTYFVDYYMRGKDRLELIKSVKDAKVHVFGDPCGSPDFHLKGWEKYLASQSNVVLHKGVSFTESLEIFKRSKICLNSVPSFKNGSHERIFISLACGCLPLTTESIYIRENFIDGEELVLYQFDKRQEVNEKINEFLNRDLERERVVSKGRHNVMLHHTWDNRVETLLEVLPSLVEKI